MATKRRPFRFGIVLAKSMTASSWKELAQKIEGEGFSTLQLADHFFLPFSPLLALLSAAHSTRHLRVGSYVLCNDFHQPLATLAKDVATLDLLSEGRFELGIGAGWNPREFQQAGLPFDSPAVRVARLEEAVLLLKKLFLASQPVTTEGTYYTLQGLISQLEPVQRPHPPLLIGGAGKKLLSFAAREADIIGINMQLGGDKKNFAEMGAARFEERIGWIREAAGDRFNNLELNLLVQKVIVTDNPDQVVDQFIATQSWGKYEVPRDRVSRVSGWDGLTRENLIGSPYYLIGSLEHIIEKIEMLREKFGVSYLSFFEDAYDTIQPVVARLADR